MAVLRAGDPPFKPHHTSAGLLLNSTLVWKKKSELNRPALESSHCLSTCTTFRMRRHPHFSGPHKCIFANEWTEPSKLAIVAKQTVPSHGEQPLGPGPISYCGHHPVPRERLFWMLTRCSWIPKSMGFISTLQITVRDINRILPLPPTRLSTGTTRLLLTVMRALQAKVMVVKPGGMLSNPSRPAARSLSQQSPRQTATGGLRLLSFQEAARSANAWIPHTRSGFMKSLQICRCKSDHIQTVLLTKLST